MVMKYCAKGREVRCCDGLTAKTVSNLFLYSHSVRVAKQLFLVKGVEAELLFGSVVVDCSERMSACEGVLDNVVDLQGW